MLPVENVVCVCVCVLKQKICGKNTLEVVMAALLVMADMLTTIIMVHILRTITNSIEVVATHQQLLGQLPTNHKTFHGVSREKFIASYGKYGIIINPKYYHIEKVWNIE